MVPLFEPSKKVVPLFEREKRWRHYLIITLKVVPLYDVYPSTISEAIILVISKSIPSKDAWNALENHFNSKNASRIMDLQRQFYNFSKGNWTTNDYVKSFKGIVKSLATVDQPVLEAAMIFAFLRGLGTDYENFVVSTNANIVHLIFEDVITNIKVHDAYLAYQRSLPSS